MELGILRKGLLYTSKSTNPTGLWSTRYQKKDYYMLVSLPMGQVNGAWDIWKENHYMLVSLSMRKVNGVRDIRKWIITC